MSPIRGRVKVAGRETAAHVRAMATLSRVGEIVRRHDPDRFYTSLFAPAARRGALWALYAFNHELARARETVREPMMAMIRLQWWREVVEGARRRHEVAEPLRDAIDAGALRLTDLLAMIEGREADAPDADDAWRAYVDATAGALAQAAGHALGAGDTDAIRAAGAAYGAAGLQRNRALAGERPVAALAAAGQEWLRAARHGAIPRQARAAALPAIFAARDLGRAVPVTERSLGDKLAVAAAAITGRI